MKIRGAVLHELGVNAGWSVEELDLDPPQAGEALVRMVSAGLCHSDYNYDTGASRRELAPFLGGHEGAGVVIEVGPGVVDVAPGDHVITSFMPSCGHCKYCAIGQGHLCDRGTTLGAGRALDGTHRVHFEGRPVSIMTYLGTFADHAVCPVDALVKVRSDAPLEKMAILGCAVPTGWGSAVYLVETQPGDTVVVIGTGGVGMNAVQGARSAGASRIIAVDPVVSRRDQAYGFGATHDAPSIDEARELLADLTLGAMAQRCIITASVVPGSMIEPALSLLGKSGVLGITGIPVSGQAEVALNLQTLVVQEKQVRGGMYGSRPPRLQIPLLVDLYQAGQLKVDELITNTYKLDDINQGYADLTAGKNLRGVIQFG